MTCIECKQIDVHVRNKSIVESQLEWKKEMVQGRCRDGRVEERG